MSEKLFEVVLTGNLIPGMDESEVLDNMAVLFKTEPGRIAKLLATPNAVIKKNIDHKTAFKYHQALRKAGALAMVRPMEEQAASPHASNQSQPSQVSANSQQDTVEQPGMTAAATPQQDDQDNGMSLADAGAEIPNLQSEKQPVNPDVSQYSMAEAGETIPTLQEHKEAVNPDTAGLSVAEAGETLGDNKPFVPREVNTTELSLGEVGETLDGNKPAAPREVNTDGLSLGEVGADLDEIKQQKTVVNPDTSKLQLDDN